MFLICPLYSPGATIDPIINLSFTSFRVLSPDRAACTLSSVKEVFSLISPTVAGFLDCLIHSRTMSLLDIPFFGKGITVSSGSKLFCSIILFSLEVSTFFRDFI